jgi:hypothetical protein
LKEFYKAVWKAETTIALMGNRKADKKEIY